MLADDEPVLNLGKLDDKGTDTLRLRLDIIAAKLGYPDSWNDEDAPFDDWTRSNKSTNIQVSVNFKVKGLASTDTSLLSSPQKYILHYQHIHTKLHLMLNLPKKDVKDKDKYVVVIKLVASTSSSASQNLPDATYTAEIPITDDWFEPTDEPLSRGGELVLPLAGKYGKPEDYSNKKFSGTDKFEWPMTEGTSSWVFCVLQKVDPEDEIEEGRISNWLNILDSSAAKNAEESFTILWSEYPQIPEGTLFLESLELFLKTKHFSPVERVNTERFAFLLCHYGDYENVLKICLKYSFNPLYTVTEAYKICDIRSERQDQKKNDMSGFKVSYMPDWFKMKSTVVGHMRTLLDFSIGLQLHSTKNSTQNSWSEICTFNVNCMYMDNVFENNIMEYFKSDVLQISCHPVITQYIDKAMENESPYPLCPWGGSISPWALYYIRLCFYIVFLVLFFLLIAHKSLESDTYQIQFTSHLESTLLDSITDISDAQGIYDWVLGILPEIDPSYLYLAHPIITMRQFRSVSVPCYHEIEPNTTCWSLYPEVTHNSTWLGTKWQVLDGIPNFIGSHYQRYPGVGYTAELSGNVTEASDYISQLNSSGWIDSGTRAVFVDIFLGSMYSRLYARVVVMFEFLPTGSMNIQSTVDTLWTESPPYFIYGVALYLLVHVFGLAVQEFYELYLNSVFSDSRLVYGDWDKCKLKEVYEQFESGEVPVTKAQIEAKETDPGIKLFNDEVPSQPSSSFLTALKGYFSDVFNYVDITVIGIIAVYVVSYISSRRNENLDNFTPQNFDFYFTLVKTAEIFGFIAAIVSCLRLLSFTLLFNTMNTFLLGLLQMIPVVGQFLIGFIVIIISFAGGLSVLYGSDSSLWSGGNEYMASALNAFTGIGNQVTNNNFQPYVLYWLGDVTLFVYFIISGIVLVNMLIAMMGSKFGDITDNHLLLRKQHFYKGSALIELEHAILPAPFNLPHLIFLLLTKSCWPYGEFDRWMYVVLPNPFIFTGQLRDMWCKYLEWKSKKNKGDDKEDEEEEEPEEDEFFKEKDQYNVNASQDELNAYVEKLQKIKPFVDAYFRNWHARYRKAVETQLRASGRLEGVVNALSDGDNDKGNSPRKLDSGKKSPKPVKSPRKQKDDEDKVALLEDKDPDYVAMTDIKG